ncbi:Inositol monophosphatase, metal-binding site [Phytophthora cactorum]|nr:Inositol monophosphatase, metal-binding site [Phytophthora cactorum]
MAAPAPDLTDMNAMLQVAIAAARAAGAHMKSHLSTSRVEKTKSSKDDLVTVVDKQCQDLVFATIKGTFPSHEFLGEENVEPGSEASARALRDMVSKEWLWIVDPIDGTTNFVHHRPASVVSVACAHLGEVVVGVIYDPYRDEIFTAQKGKGTFLNGQPAHVSQEASFSEALVGFGIGTKDSVRLPMLDCAREFSAKCRGLRLQGAAAIELAWTAAGRQSEAGGEVTNSDGTPFSLSTRNIVVSNNKGDIHASMIELIKKADAVNKSFTLIAHNPKLSTHHSPSQSQFGQDGGAVPAQYHVSTWFFVCGPLAVNTFLLGLAANLHVFKKNNLAFDRVMDMRPDEIPTAGGVFKTGFFMCLLQFLLFNGEAARRGDAFGVDETRMEMLLLGYFRMFVLRKLARCFWPFQQFSFKLPTHATPFIEVFMADGMTSLSKFIQDLSVALMLLVMSFTSEPEDLRESYISKLKESPLPYFAASTPYIDAVFNLVSTDTERERPVSSPAQHDEVLLESVGDLGGSVPDADGAGTTRAEQLLLAVCGVQLAVLVPMGVVMDWGLGQPKLPRRVAFLRHQLIYRPRKIYYLVIVVDFVLRIMWVAKWWDWMHRGVHFKLVAQVAEVVRRIVWNFVRVEWQCIKLDILATKKLSADTVELDEMIEKVPLMQEHEDDLEDMKPRMRTLSRPNSFSAEASGTETSSTLSQSPLHDNTDSELFLQVDAESSSGRDVQRDEMIAPAAITVASYPEKPQAMLVSYGDAHQRWESSPNKATTEGAEADEL